MPVTYDSLRRKVNLPQEDLRQGLLSATDRFSLYEQAKSFSGKECIAISPYPSFQSKQAGYLGAVFKHGQLLEVRDNGIISLGTRQIPCSTLSDLIAVGSISQIQNGDPWNIYTFETRGDSCKSIPEQNYHPILAFLKIVERSKDPVLLLTGIESIPQPELAFNRPI